MKYCSNYGMKLEEGVKFCQKCGTQVAPSEEQRAVPVESDIRENSTPENSLPSMEWSLVAGFWALSMISLLFFITSLIVAWMFHARSEKLETLISGENLLAEWRLTPQQKESYINYFLKQESLIGLILFLSFFAFVMPIYYRSSNRKGDGRILIGTKYAYINGYFHNWDFPLSRLSKIKIIKEPFYGIYLVYYYTDRTLEHSEELFIPADEDMDLEGLMQSMKEQNLKRKRK